MNSEMVCSDAIPMCDTITSIRTRMDQPLSPKNYKVVSSNLIVDLKSDDSMRRLHLPVATELTYQLRPELLFFVALPVKWFSFERKFWSYSSQRRFHDHLTHSVRELHLCRSLQGEHEQNRVWSLFSRILVVPGENEPVTLVNSDSRL